MENKSHAFAAGLFALLLGVAALFAVYWLGGSQDDTHDYVVVTKQNIGGLNPQAQVRYRGIRVGKVSDIRLDPDDYSNILITISVSDDVPLTKGTVAKLNYQGVTGLAHILLLETGKDPAPLEADDAHPPRIAMIPSLLDELGETGAATLKQARQLLGSADAVLNEENRRELHAALANLAQATATLGPTLQTLNTTLGQVNKLLDDGNVGRLSQAAGEIGPLLGETRQLVGSLRTVSGRLESTLGDTANAAATALPRVEAAANDLSQASRQASRVLRRIEDAPQGLLFGVAPPPPGPGEPGFDASGGK